MDPVKYVMRFPTSRIKNKFMIHFDNIDLLNNAHQFYIIDKKRGKNHNKAIDFFDYRHYEGRGWLFSYRAKTGKYKNVKVKTPSFNKVGGVVMKQHTERQAVYEELIYETAEDLIDKIKAGKTI